VAVVYLPSPSALPLIMLPSKRFKSPESTSASVVLLLSAVSKVTADAETNTAKAINAETKSFVIFFMKIHSLF